MKFTKDILTKVIIKSTNKCGLFITKKYFNRFSVLTIAVSNINQHYTCIIETRPLHAVAINGDSYF